MQRRTNLFERELEELPESNYKSTYRPKDCKPRSSKRPLRSPPVFTENGDPCNFETAYKSEFKPLDLSDKVTLSKKVSNSNLLWLPVAWCFQWSFCVLFRITEDRSSISATAKLEKVPECRPTKRTTSRWTWEKRIKKQCTVQERRPNCKLRRLLKFRKPSQTYR